MKISPVGAVLFHAGRWTGRHTVCEKRLVRNHFLTNKQDITLLRLTFNYVKENKRCLL